MYVNITLLILLSSRTPLHGKLNYRKFIYVFFFLKKKAVVHTASVPKDCEIVSYREDLLRIYLKIDERHNFRITNEK